MTLTVAPTGSACTVQVLYITENRMFILAYKGVQASGGESESMTVKVVVRKASALYVLG